MSALPLRERETEMARFLPRRQRSQLGGEGYRVIRDRRPATDEWNWEELDPGRLRSWVDYYPTTVRDLLPS